MALDHREREFALAYIANGCNAHQAALKAGYRPRTARHAYQWLEDDTKQNQATRRLPYKPELAQFIAEELDKMEAASRADAQEVIRYLSSVMRGETQSSVLALCGEGCQEVIEKPPDEKERLKAAEILAKVWGIVNSNVNVTIPDPVVITGAEKLED